RAEDGSTMYARGQVATFKVISGHRDSSYTACPGQRLYNRMGDIRRLTKKYMGSNLVEPSASPNVVHLGHRRDVTVKSRVLQQQTWTLTATGLCGGGVVRKWSGTAGPHDPIKVVWNGRDESGERVAGRYRLKLSSSGGGTQAWPWSSSVAMGVGGAARASTGKTMGRAHGGTYVPIKPRVIADSATGQGVARPLMLGPGSRVDVPVRGRGGVPATDVSSVAVSVVASCSTSPTEVSVAPGGIGVHGANVVSLGRNSSARGFTLVRLGPDGGLTFRNAAGAVALNVSVVGYVSTAGGGGSLVPLPRHRLGGASPLRVTPHSVQLPVAGRARVPSSAQAVVLNVRRAGGSKVGALWAWPAGTHRPAPSTWRRDAGSAASSRVIVPIGDGGAIRVAGDRRGDVSFDVVGYVAASTTHKVHALVPKTITKGSDLVRHGDTVNLRVGGRAGVPDRAASALVQVSGDTGSRGAALTVWPRGRTRPSPVDLLVPRRADRDGFVLVPIGKRGQIRVHAAKGSARVRVTVLGWVG
ncbi:MAG TPA: hypothetical protein VMT27_00900, partial [Actinomycetes bacterium]|nr:hypothetical protein [Actinomycetes bacterium]